jgi:drug/metabolite transporter (DMT)-like permease
MNKKRILNILLVFCYIAVLIINTLITKYLTKNNIDGSFILFNRGLVCFIIVLIAASTSRKGLIPQKPMIQLTRFFVAGLSLICITNSFKFANAATISLIQRLEVLIVIIVASIFSKAFFSFRNYYSLAIIIASLFFLFYFKNVGEYNKGIFLALLGTVFVVIGYFLIKRVVAIENYLVITLTSSLGATIFGLAFSFYRKTINYQLHTRFLALLVLLGILMFITYRLTTFVYSKYNIETAQYFSFLAIVSIMPIEHLFIGSNMTSVYTIGLIAFSTLITSVIFIPVKISI